MDYRLRKYIVNSVSTVAILYKYNSKLAISNEFYKKQIASIKSNILDMASLVYNDDSYLEDIMEFLDNLYTIASLYREHKKAFCNESYIDLDFLKQFKNDLHFSSQVGILIGELRNEIRERKKIKLLEKTK